MKVTVYSTQSCPWCKKVKAFLTENKVKFSDKDVGSDTKAAQEMIKKSGQQGVPVTEVDGNIVVGFDEAKLKKLLNLK
jgi:glutaredoxin 3